MGRCDQRRGVAVKQLATLNFNGAPPGVFVVQGDSVAAGGQGDVTAGLEYASLVMPLLAGSFALTNLAVGGKFLKTTPPSGCVAEVPLTTALIDATARAKFGSTLTGILVLDACRNDVINAGGFGQADLAELIARMTELLEDSRAGGWSGTNKIIVMGACGFDAAICAPFNTWLETALEDELCDGIVRLGNTGLADIFDGTLYLEETGLHPNAFAHATIMAPMLAAECNRLVSS